MRPIEIVISDDGPAFPPDSEPDRRALFVAAAHPRCQAAAGLGLGVFIARTLLERTGAKVSFTNRTFPEHGAVVQIAWPKERFETIESLEETIG